MKEKILNLNLVIQILIGMFLGLVLGSIQIILTNNNMLLSLVFVLDFIKVFGTLFTGALRAIAPILVFVLIINTIASHKGGSKINMGAIVKVYLFATFIAAILAVVISFLNPVELTLNSASSDITAAPTSVVDVLLNVLNNIVDNPINALATANYLGVLFWALLIGYMLKEANESTKNMLADFSHAVSLIVQLIIKFAPLGIMGLIYASIVDVGFVEVLKYTQLLVNLLLAMGIMAFLINPIIVFVLTRKNPYPLVFKCLRVSGITAFFTRSSAANIPINISLAEELGIDDELYNISIPLGSTVNMAGAAITITTLTLAAAYTVGIDVTFGMAVMLSLLAAISACGASGVSGGSLLLIPMACSLFGIDPAIAAEVVGIGFVISVVQDSCETALNSSSDILYTAAVDIYTKRKK